MNTLWWTLIPLGYLVGAVPWGLVIGKVIKGVDVREYGSGKTGMTNVLRTVGIQGAILVVVADLGKGALPVLFAHLFTEYPPLEASVALAVLVGHNWSVFIRFQGGRGIITGFAGLAVLVPLASVASLAGLLVVALLRYVSLGSLVGTAFAVITIVLLYFLEQIPISYLLYALVGGAIITAQHRDNILRLAHGNERRLGERAEPLSSFEKN